VPWLWYLDAEGHPHRDRVGTVIFVIGNGIIRYPGNRSLKISPPLHLHLQAFGTARAMESSENLAVEARLCLYTLVPRGKRR
jgi:hypothetical protein